MKFTYSRVKAFSLVYLCSLDNFPILPALSDQYLLRKLRKTEFMVNLALKSHSWPQLQLRHYGQTNFAVQYNNIPCSIRWYKSHMQPPYPIQRPSLDFAPLQQGMALNY